MIDIRSLNKDDKFDDLILLSREFFDEYETHHKDFFKIDNLKDEHIVGYFTFFRNSEFREAFIAVDDAQIVGYITVYVKEQADYWQVKRVGEISGLMVRKDYRRRGIASRLFVAAKEFFVSQGLKYYTVYTAVENQGAIDFYQQNGLAPLYSTMIGEIQQGRLG